MDRDNLTFTFAGFIKETPKCPVMVPKAVLLMGRSEIGILTSRLFPFSERDARQLATRYSLSSVNASLLFAQDFAYSAH